MDQKDKILVLKNSACRDDRACFHTSYCIVALGQFDNVSVTMGGCERQTPSAM